MGAGDDAALINFFSLVKFIPVCLNSRKMARAGGTVAGRAGSGRWG